MDLVLVGEYKSEVRLLIGRGDGTFEPPLAYPLMALPAGIAGGQFGGDELKDVAVSTPRGVELFFGSPSGVLVPGAELATGPSCRKLTADDFDGDGREDMAVTNYDTTPGVTVLRGLGAGGFETSTHAVPGAPQLIAAGDVTGDGKVDLVVAAAASAGSLTRVVSLLPGDGKGSFQEPVELFVGAHVVGIAVADLDGDLRADYAVADDVARTTTVFLSAPQAGPSTFVHETLPKEDLLPQALALADVNYDSCEDLLIGEASFGNLDPNGTGAVAVLLGNCRGDFGSALRYDAGYAWSITIADFNGDGAVDLATTNGAANTVTILLNQHAGRPRL